MATGWAIGRGEPALAILHTTPGLGNAVSALATARVNRAPLVVVVGQQDRRHIATEPFLAGRLQGLAGDYPVWVDQPVRAQDVPGAVARAHHEAATGRGTGRRDRADGRLVGGRVRPRRARRTASRRSSPGGGRRTPSLSSPAFSAAPRALRSSSAREPTTPDTWAALVALAERLACPVWQEPFSARAGFPQDHVLFAGHLPADRTRLRRHSRRTTSCWRWAHPCSGSTLSLPARSSSRGRASRWSARRRPRYTGARPTSRCSQHRHPSAGELARIVPARGTAAPGPFPAPEPPEAPAVGEPLRAAHVFSALAERLPRNVVVIEESPVESAGAARAAACAGAARLPEPGNGRARVCAPRGDRPAHGATRPARRRDRRGRFVALLDPGALECRALPRRGAVRDPLERRLRDHGSTRRAARRNGAVAGRSESTSRVSPGVRLPCAHSRRPRRAARACSTRSCRAWRDRDEPLLLEVAVAPDESFVP